MTLSCLIKRANIWWQKLRNLAVKSLPGLIRGITLNHNGDFYCLNCFHSYKTKNRLKNYKKVCNDHDYCHVKMPKKRQQNIRIQPGRKVIKNDSYYLCWLRMFTKKDAFMSK